MARHALFILLLVSASSLAQSGAPQAKSGGSVSGSVLRADNSQPIKKAKISLEPNLDEASAASLSQDQALSVYRDRMMESETDETGHFLFSDVLPGKYYLRAEKIGFVASNARRIGQGVGLPLTVTAGEAVKDVEIRFRPAGAITGRVLNEDGEPMANVSVQALRYSYAEGRRGLATEGQAETNDLGEYRIFNLLPNKYYVRATAPNSEAYTMAAKRQPNKPAQSYWPTFFPDAKSAVAATRLDVKPSDEQHANFNLVPAESFIVSGKVLGIPPAPRHAMSMGTAMLISKDGDTIAGTTMLSAAEPIFFIGPVPPGDYQLVAYSAEIWAGMTREDVQNVRTGHQPVKVISSDVSNLTLTLDAKPPVQLAGRVRLDPAPATAVDLRRLFVTFDPSDEDTGLESGFGRMDAMVGSRELENGQVSRDGTFKAKFGANSGVIQAHLAARGSGQGFEDYYTKSVLLGGRDVTESGISPAKLTPGAALELVVSPYGGRVDGTVLDSNKKPVVAAFVACVPTDPKLRSRRELFITDSTNQKGHYVLRGLRPGAYKLYAFDELDPGAIYSPEFLKPFEDMGESIEVKEKDRITKPLQVLHHTED